MISRMMCTAVCVLSLVAGACQPASGQEVVDKKTFEGVVSYQIRDFQSIESMTIFMKRGRLRLEGSEQAGGNAILTDFSAKKCYVIISGREQYAELPLLFVPPKGEGSTPRVNVQKTDVVDAVEGFECNQFLVTVDTLEFEIWATKEFNGPGSFLSAQVSEWMMKILDMGYFPMRFVARDATGEEIKRFEVTSVTKKPLTESLFRIPSGYEKIDPEALQPKQQTKKKKR
jgi:hypothetical protein